MSEDYTNIYPCDCVCFYFQITFVPVFSKYLNPETFKVSCNTTIYSTHCSSILYSYLGLHTWAQSQRGEYFPSVTNCKFQSCNLPRTEYNILSPLRSDCLTGTSDTSASQCIGVRELVSSFTLLLQSLWMLIRIRF